MSRLISDMTKLAPLTFCGFRPRQRLARAYVCANELPPVLG